MSKTDQTREYANEAILSASYARTNEADEGLLEFEHLPHSADSASAILVDDHEPGGTVESYERELIRRRHTEIQLREALVREDALRQQKDKLI